MLEIRNVADFGTVLDATIAQIDGLVVSEPNYRIWGMLHQQLYYLKDWSRTATDVGTDRRNAISIGRIAARELEPTNEAWMQDLIDRLYLLNDYWRHWPTGDTRTDRRPWKGGRKLAAGAVTLALVAAALTMALYFVARTEAGPATPIGKSMPIPGAVATLTSSLEPYTVSLHHNPGIERYQIQLRLTDSSHDHPDRLIPIAQHMQANELPFDVKLLGDDGHRLWFYVGSIGAWDYLQNTLISADDLRRANPTLGKFERKDNRGDPLISPTVARIAQTALDLWSGEARMYGYDGRLKVTTPDFQGLYAIDPETLHVIAE